MAYKLKGFLQLSASLNNTPSTISAFGELSNMALTYSREQKVYINNVQTTMLLRTFYSKDDNGSVDVPDPIKDKVFELTQWIYDTQFGNGSYVNKVAFLSALTTQFGSSITGIKSGDLIANSDNKYFPKWIEFTLLNVADNLFYDDNTIKIWYSDESFRLEYDESELIVIPPVTDLNSLFSIKAQAQVAIDNFRDNSLINSINTATNNLPSTRILSETYLWKEPLNPTNTLNTIWTIIVYGNIVGNSDFVKEAIRTYISDNSTRTQNEWKAVLPDIFISTEFYIFPKWSNMSISERELQVGQYSSIVNLKKELDYIKGFFTLVPNSHIDNFLSVIPFQYKSLCGLVISSDDNRDNIFNIRNVYPDYLNVPTTEILFQLQSVKTREWVIKLGHALEAAENAGEFGTIPEGMKRLSRNNILYIVFKHDNIDYLISTKGTTPGYTN